MSNSSSSVPVWANPPRTIRQTTAGDNRNRAQTPWKDQEITEQPSRSGFSCSCITSLCHDHNHWLRRYQSYYFRSWIFTNGKIGY